MGLDSLRSPVMPTTPDVAPEVSLIVPVYNEAGPMRRDAFRHMLDDNLTMLDKEFTGSHEVLVVDDGSADASGAIAREFGVSVVSHPDGRNHGKGASLRLGMLSAKGAYRAFADADGSYRPETVFDLIDEVAGVADVAVAYRASDGHASGLRGAGHHVLERACDLIAPTDSIDTQAGAKAFTAQSAEAIWPQVQTARFGADREAMYIARRLGFRTANVPANVHAVSGSHIRPVRDGTRLVTDTVRTRFRHR